MNRPGSTSARGRSRGRKRRAVLLLLLLGSIGLAASARLSRPAGWQAVAPGLSYQRLSIAASEHGDTARLHVLRLDPARCRVRLVAAGQGKTATARQFAERHRAIAAINGGFFDEDFRPLGLRVSAGKELRPLRRADWGVFLLRGGRPRIVHTRDYQPRGVTEAVQCGPRLVVAGEVTRLKRQSARRSCVGIDARGRILLAVSDGPEVDATYLARALRAPEADGGLGVRDALNLDGGPSTQLYAAQGGFQLDLPGAWGVPDGLGVFAR